MPTTGASPLVKTGSQSATSLNPVRQVRRSRSSVGKSPLLRVSTDDVFLSGAEGHDYAFPRPSNVGGWTPETGFSGSGLAGIRTRRTS